MSGDHEDFWPCAGRAVARSQNVAIVARKMSEQPQPEVESTKLLIANGALLEAPIYETHYRGANWLAVIDVDASCPGGLSRRFTSRGKGECLYLVEQIGLFDPVEFGADYTTTYGDKKRDRWHGVVTAKTDDFLIVERCKTGARAVIRSKELRTSPEALRVAMTQERETLIARAGKLDQQIQELSTSGPTLNVESTPETVPVEEPLVVDPPGHSV